MTTSSIRRQMKNVVNNYTEAEIKVREATSNDPWGPSSSLMAEIADLTYNMMAFTEVMGILWRRLNDHGKNWRHVYKALGLMDYLVKTGSDRVAQECRDNIYSIQTLKDFQYIDRDAQDQGQHIREKAKNLVSLLKDPEKLKKERSQALKTRSRMVGVQYSLGDLPPPYPGSHSSHYGTYPSRSSPSSMHWSIYHHQTTVIQCPASSSSSPRLAPDLEQARPTTSGEEELQLQLALAMSRESEENSQLQSAGKTVKKPSKPMPATMDMDDDAQLKLALNMSKETHVQTAFMDLVDVFSVSSDPPLSDQKWKKTAYSSSVHTRGSSSWDPLDGSSSSSRLDSPWLAPPTSTSPPPTWEPSLPPGNPWDAPKSSASKLWGLSTNTEGDLFDEAMDGGPMDGGPMNINGRRESSPEIFDLTQLRQSLVEPTPRTLRTPEAFLGPSAASLVNLETLIPAQPATLNPFLSDGVPPATSNPFQVDQTRLTLNQMGSATLEGSLPYSASLPLPINHQPVNLPSSYTHPTQTALDLPEPLLPFSTGSTLDKAAPNNQNPFL
ncbi:epsin-3 isoform X4 [Nerophis ophidion]|uniref:epsin-3 isoform X4 n=1 Tax=Nerophis ophidion TaxID=159077 RepID=UPI002ADF95CA|nr:epsin-3 isoform X4 [Nerophis ophidion]